MVRRQLELEHNAQPPVTSSASRARRQQTPLFSPSTSTMPLFISSPQTILSRSPRATILAVIHSNEYDDHSYIREPTNDALLVLLPLLIVLSTFLFLLLLFLICVLLLRRRRGIALRDTDGPIDMSRDDLVQGEGGFDGVESRWLESVNDSTRRMYSRAKGAFPFHL